VRWFKIGPALYLASGPAAIKTVAEHGCVFLDVKFHDIPATVAAGVSSAARLGVGMITVHAWGGRAMLEAARDAAATAASGTRAGPRILGVTVLTSGDASSLREIGITEPPADAALRLARLARACGLHGVVASPLDAPAIRRECGNDWLIVCPGVRPAGAGADDQRRMATPRDAIVAGADMLVVGRPVIRAEDPRAAALAILDEIASAPSGRSG
jgi:orotidine-5'-phosphate decarboxylase